MSELPQELHGALARYQSRVEQALDQCMPAINEPPSRLHEAMRYATLNGGKRIRAALVYICGEMLGCDDGQLLDDAACALELIHAYSLVHDDLPAMDNDDLRRGRPTCHRAFDEATALLAGDALQTLAFELLSHGRHADTRLAMVNALAEASGSLGMAGGQAIDLAAVGDTMNLEALEDMHLKKTGALIRAACRLGGLAADADEPTLEKLDDYGRNIGLAFQVVDDILDVEGDTATLGKTAGADESRNKPTYPALLGLEAARARAHGLEQAALACLPHFGDNASLLSELATYIVSRNR